MPGASFPTGVSFTYVVSGTFTADFVNVGNGNPAFPQPQLPNWYNPPPKGYLGPYWNIYTQEGDNVANSLYEDKTYLGFITGIPAESYAAIYWATVEGDYDLIIGAPPGVAEFMQNSFMDPFGRVLDFGALFPPTSGAQVVSWSLSYPVNEWVNFSDVTFPVPGRNRTKYLVCPAGSLFTFTYTNRGGTFTRNTGTTPSDCTVEIRNVTFDCSPLAFQANNRNCAATLTNNGAKITAARTKTYMLPQTIYYGVGAQLAETTTYDYTNGISIKTLGGGQVGSSFYNGTGWNGNPIYGWGQAGGHGALMSGLPDKTVTIEGTIYGFGGGAYPNAPQNVDFYCKGTDGGVNNAPVLVPCRPGCNFTYTQRNLQILEWVAGTPAYVIDEQGPIWANVDPGINAVGDVADPLYGHDVTYNSFTVEHLASLVIDDFNNAVPGAWSSSGATITTTTYTAIAATAGGASGTYTYSGTKPTLEAYRFANIVLNTQVGANVPLNVKINGKTWAITSGPTPGADITRQIDLCCPTSQDSSASGSEDTAFPRTSGNNTGPAITDSQHGGVGAVKTFTIAGIPNGETVEVKSLTGVRTTEALLDSSLQSTGPYLPYGGLDSGGRLILANVDGHQGLEVLGNSNPGTTSQVDLTLTQLIAAINSFPGWNATTTSPSHVYYNNTQDANWLGAAANSGFLGKDVSALTTLQATSLFRTADTYPGDDAGNTLNFVVWERGELHGLTLDSSGQPVTGQAVTTSPNGGSGTSDSLAYFQCGTPWLLPGLTYTIVQSGDMGFACLRKKTRAIGSPTGGGKNPWNLETVTGQYYKVDVENGNAVFYGSDFSTPLPAWTSTSTITSTGDVTDPRIAMDHRGVLYVVYARTISGAVSVYTQSSFDFGASWTGEVSLPITDGFHPTLAVSDTGIVVRGAFVYDSGVSGPGTLWATIQFPGDANQSAPFQLLDNTGPPGVALAVADDTFHIQFAADTPQRWLLTCRLNAGSGTSDFQSWDFCQTWTVTT